MCPLSQTVLSTDSDFAVAVAAIHWSATARFEWYFSVFAALGAFYWEHLAWGTVAIATIPIAAAIVSVLLCFPCLAAWGTALRLVGIAS